jgi:hypothetical protein
MTRIFNCKNTQNFRQNCKKWKSFADESKFPNHKKTKNFQCEKKNQEFPSHKKMTKNNFQATKKEPRISKPQKTPKDFQTAKIGQEFPKPSNLNHSKTSIFPQFSHY